MSDAKVIPINTKKSKEEKSKKIDVIVAVSQCLHPETNFNGISLRRSGFDVRLLESENGSRRWVKASENKVLAVVDEESIGFKISSSVFGVFPDNYDLTTKDIKEILATAMHTAEYYDLMSVGEKIIIREEEVAPMLFKSQEGWTWHRLPYDPDIDDTEAAAFWTTEVFPRFKKNFEPFMAWCGSLFDPKSSRVLCPWLYGEGNSGKGTIAVWIMNCIGDAGTVGDPDHISFDSFALEMMEGKRLCFVDETPAALPTSSKFKRITGEKYQLVNRKGKKAIKMLINTKFLFASNKFPKIKSGKEFARRLMPVPFQEIDGMEREKEDVWDLMNKHGSYFWGVAIKAYQENKNLKRYDYSEIEEFQEDENEIIDLWIQKNIDIGVSSSFFPIRTAMLSAEASKIDWFKAKRRLTEFYNVKCDTRKINGAAFKCLIGCRWKGVDFGPNFDQKEPEIDF